MARGVHFAAVVKFVRTVTALALLGGLWGLNAQIPSAPNAASPAPKSQDPLSRDTPQSSVVNFLEACHAKDYSKARRYLDLRSLPENQRAQNGRQLAEQLAQVLDRDPRFDVAALSREHEGDTEDGQPKNTDLVDTFTVDGKPQQLTLERTTLRSGLQVWLFSPAAVSLIPKLAAMATGSPIDKYLPAQLVNWTLLDTSLWRWIAMVLLAIVLAVLSQWIARLALLIADAVIGRTRFNLDKTILHSFAGPFQLLLPVAMFRASFTALGLSALLRLRLEHLCTFLVIAGFAWLAFRVVDAFISGLRGFLTKRKRVWPYSTMALASRLLKVSAVIFAFTAMLTDWGYNTSTIVAGLGVGGIAIALAAQKTIENLFGGVSVISDRPVRVGDYCKFGNNSGTIEDIGLRSTRIRTADRTLVTVPNGSFAAMTLENFNARDKMLFHITLNLRRDTTPEQVRTVLGSVGETLRQNLKIEGGVMPVRFTGIGSYSLDLEVFVYILTRDGDEFLRIQQELLLTILDEIAAAGTALALPTQASVTYSSPDQKNEPEPANNGRR